MKSLSLALAFCATFLLHFPKAQAQIQPRWRALPNAPRTNFRFDDVSFINPNEGWVIGSEDEIFYTSDGGVTWKVQGRIPLEVLRCIGFANAAKGWVGTLHPNDFFFSTIDSSKTWLKVLNIPEPKPQGICGISVVNENVVYASGYFDGTPRVIKTLNGGQTWQTMNLSAFARGLVDCYFLSPDSGFVVGAAGNTFEEQQARVLSTADGGQTWSVRFTGARPSELCWKISFPNRNAGYVSIEAFNRGAIYFLKTTDGGMTWQDNVLSNTLRDVQGIGFVNENLGWEGGWGSPTYETTDGGATWHPAGFGMNINRFRLLNDTLGYAVGQTVYKYSITPPPVAVEEPATSFPAGFTLYQNYPNPFNPSTRIRYQLGRDDEVVILAVYDLAGKKIKTLFAGGRTPGDYVADWDGTADSNQPVAAGIYVYRLQAGAFVQSRKMIFLR